MSMSADECHQKQRYWHAEQPAEADGYDDHLRTLPTWVCVHRSLELANLILLLWCQPRD